MPTSRETVARRRAAVRRWGGLPWLCLFWAWLCVLAGAPGHALALGPADFLGANRIPQGLAAKLLSGAAPVDACSENEGVLFCAKGRQFPHIAGNGLAREAVLKGLGISVRAALDRALARKVRARDLRDQRAVGEALGRVRAGGGVTLKGVRFTTFCRGDWCGAVAALPLAAAERDLPQVYARPEFVEAYCATVFPAARQQLEAGRYREALPALEELRRLRCAPGEASLLAVEACLRAGEEADGVKIARELLEACPPDLDADGAEKLGDLFLELHMDAEAEKAFDLAAQLLGQQ